VPLKTDAYFKTIAETALRQTGITEPPVQVEAVAAHFGIPVRLVRLPAFFFGATMSEDGLPVIVLNDGFDDVSRQRTLAHLIAHVLLLMDDPNSSYPRDTHVHHEAEVVATELVTPAWMVIEQSAKWFNDYRYLARLFGVSEAEMTTRMQALGLLKPHGLAWDY
jgi:Zn-dependent peptidase ImmA (M78 family)